MEETFFVYYADKQYNILPFLDKHPAGRSILLQFKDKDITTAFNDVGHSSKAKSLLSKYLCGGDEKKSDKLSEEPKESPDWRKRLFTAEDKYFIHKFLGLTNLFFYIYKYIYMPLYFHHLDLIMIYIHL